MSLKVDASLAHSKHGTLLFSPPADACHMRKEFVRQSQRVLGGLVLLEAHFPRLFLSLSLHDL